MDPGVNSTATHTQENNLSVFDLIWDAQNILNVLDVLSREMVVDVRYHRDAIEIFLNSLAQVAIQIEYVVRRPSFRRNKARRDAVGVLATNLLDASSALAKVRSRFFEALQHIDDQTEAVAQAQLVRTFLHKNGNELIRLHHRLQKSSDDLGLAPSMDTSLLKVFICHAAEDKRFARKLANDLRTLGLDVWFDEWSMLPGDSLYHKIEQGIRSSAWFIIILSPSSVQSKWCKRELREAMEEEFERNKVYVVPVLYRDCRLPAFLRDKIWIDCRARKYREAIPVLRRRFGL